MSLTSVSPNNIIIVATIKLHAAGFAGKVGGAGTEIVLDSGPSVISFISGNINRSRTATTSTSAVPNSIWRVIAYHIIDYVSVDVQLDTICTSIHHNFLVVTSLIATVILGIDVFQQHGLILNQLFKFIPSKMTFLLTYKTCSTTRAAYKMIAAIRESSTDIIMGCAIPDYGALQQYKLPA